MDSQVCKKIMQYEFGEFCEIDEIDKFWQDCQIDEIFEALNKFQFESVDVCKFEEGFKEGLRIAKKRLTEKKKIMRASLNALKCLNGSL